jgi:hypothetical protein
MNAPSYFSDENFKCKNSWFKYEEPSLFKGLSSISNPNAIDFIE